MGRKPKYSKETKLLVVKQYKEGLKSSIQIANELNCYYKTVLRWVKQFEAYGEVAFDDKPRNKAYSKDLKLSAIEEYLSGEGSYLDIALKYGITSEAILINWVKRYNSHKEIEDYDPKGDVYMTKSRKTSYDERLEIIAYCIENNRNYKLTAEHFDVPYSQVYQWVKKHDEKGEKGLLDGRGHRKEEFELTETERLERELEAKERRIQRLEMENDILKKLQEVERGNRLAKLAKKQNTKR